MTNCSLILTPRKGPGTRIASVDLTRLQPGDRDDRT